MGIADESVKFFHGGWSAIARPCDSCESAAALVFCRVDSAFLCAACDEKAHDGGRRRGEEHERVWMCEVCEQAPAAVTCKADAAALCVTCDSDIHSANPLARRHDRLPIVPFFQPASSLLKSSPTFAASVSVLVQNGVVNPSANDEVHSKALEEAEAASWILPNPSDSSNHKFADQDIKPTELFLSDADPFLDFEYSASMDARFADSVVPVQKRAIAPSQLLSDRASSENCFDLDFARSKLAPYSYAAAQSLSQSVSSDVGVVPDGNSMSDVSFPFVKQMNNGGNGGGDPNSSAASQATQLSGTEREARVLRYREKRKYRKFEKTIRYASRKAYAESRPRIKGRFAKRTEMEAEVDACFYGSSSSVASAAFDLAADSGYSIVPSF